MQREIKKYLFDIQSCIENIETFVGEPKIYSNFESNLMMQQAVERNIEIIGEAMTKMLKISPDMLITNSRRIVDARNKIIHSYDDIQMVQIWNIIINHLPLLKQEVDKLLQ